MNPRSRHAGAGVRERSSARPASPESRGSAGQASNEAKIMLHFFLASP